MVHFAIFITVVFTAMCAIAQQQPPQPPRNQCVNEVQQLAAACFQKSGLPLQTIDAVLTNGTISPLPQNVNIMDLRKRLCSIRADIIQCIVPPTLNKRGKAPCTNSHEFNFAENQVVRRLTALQNACGAGVMPQSNSCLRSLDGRMQKCYVKVGLKPSMFGSNETEIKGAIIGKDRKAATKFCGVRARLFSCMRTVIESCQGANEYMLLTGYDHASMEASIDLLCKDVDVYVQGLSCFQKPSTKVHKCLDEMSSRMVDLAALQIKDNMNMDKFFSEYCKIRIDHLGCDMGAWKESCTKADVGLKNEFECTMLPASCQKDANLQKTLQDNVCNVQGFYRAQRNTGRNGSTVPRIGSFLVFAVSSLLFLL